MFRRSALSAAASLAVVLFAATGCKVQVSSAAPGGSSAGFYIHGKVVEPHYGTDHGKIFIGSGNFSNTSLNQNRELGLIISSHAVMSAIAGTFASDFRNGKHWSPT
jgi:phosphatidylserine/phosphatidylglycerophosphate/cardiolipin synthase-like enzyme